VRRPRVRARRFARVPPQAGVRHPRRRSGGGARGPHGHRQNGGRRRRLGREARSRHHLRARRHARIRRARRKDPRRTRARRGHRARRRRRVITRGVRRQPDSFRPRVESSPVATSTQARVSTPQTTAAREGGLFTWWIEADLRARRPFVAASLGWMLDSFDVMLYAMVLTALISDPVLRLSREAAGALGSITLVAAAAGGIAFGVVADRLGRKRALMGAVLIYSIFT